MPLRDHFHPPFSKRHQWSSFFSAWLYTMVRELNLNRLPERYRAMPLACWGILEGDALFELQVVDDLANRQLVAVLELVHPGIKVNHAHSQVFVEKCIELLKRQVAVAIVDVVAGHNGDLHDELLRQLEGGKGPTTDKESTDLHARVYRPVALNEAGRLEIWVEELTPGTALPTLPLWLNPTLAVPLELEATYEETLRVLRL